MSNIKVPTVEHYLGSHPDHTWGDYSDLLKGLRKEARALKNGTGRRLESKIQAQLTRKREFEKMRKQEEEKKNEVIKIHTELAKAQNGFAVAQVQMTAVHQDLLLKKRKTIADISESEDDASSQEYVPSNSSSFDDSEETAEEDEERTRLEILARHLEVQSKRLRKTMLPSGSLLENKMQDIALRLEKESPIHSFIFDIQEMDELRVNDPDAIDQTDLDFVRSLWEERPSSRYLPSTGEAKYEQFSTPGLQSCRKFLEKLENMIEERKNLAEVMTAVLRTRPVNERPLKQLYIVILDFLESWEDDNGSARREGDYMRLWNKLFEKLRPGNIRVSAPEEPVPASKDRKLRNAGSERKGIRARKAHMLWEANDHAIAWMEAKKGSWTEDPEEAEDALLKATKGSKDMMDFIQKATQKTVETWSCVNFKREWRLRSSYRIASGVVVIGDVGRWALPQSFAQFRGLLDLCRVILLWGIPLEQVADAVTNLGFTASPPRLLPIADTFTTPVKSKQWTNADEASPSRKRPRRK